MGKDLNGKELGANIYQRKDGRYCGRFDDRFGNRKTLYNKELKKLKSDLNDAIYEDKNQMSIIDERITLNIFFEEWLETYKYNVIRESTKVTYVNLYNKHIKPVLGKKKIKDITSIHIRELLKAKDKEGLGYEVKNKIRIVLNDIFNKALIDNFIQKNPANGIKINRDKEKDKRILSKEEQILFFNCCKGTFYDNLFITAINTGLRPGELFALTWEDIDFMKKEINVNKTLLYQKLTTDTKKEFHINPPKTASSKRMVPMTEQCREALLRQKTQYEVIKSRTVKKLNHDLGNLVFTTKFGTPLNSQIYIDAIKRIIDEINLLKDDVEKIESFGGHTFRHLFATRCFEANIPPKTVQAYLGHSSLTMTMDLYTHVLSDKKAMEIQKLVISSGEELKESDLCMQF